MAIPELTETRRLVHNSFSKNLCTWQYRLSQAVLADSKHVFLNVGTGQGKTLAFWTLALLARRRQKITVVVTALNVLGKQNEDQLAAAGIPAISLNAETATDATYKVSTISMKSDCAN